MAVFALGAVLLLAATRTLIPVLVGRYDLDPLLAWFLAAGIGVFAPLLVLGWAFVRAEGTRSAGDLWSDRLRFRRLSGSDWPLIAGAMAAVALLTALVVLALLFFEGRAALHPAFLPGVPLSSGRYWLLSVWPLFWVVNIFGEEFLWRGVLLPRQEVAHGSWAWIFNGAGWSLFHAAMGWQIVLLLPMSFILPYAVQRSQNTWVGVILHATLNGPAFLAVSFGALA